MIHFILASRSPRRRELLQLCGYPFEIKTHPVNEDSVTHPDPVQNCIQTAQLKSQTLAHNFNPHPSTRTLIIAADTIVAVDGQMLGKPGDRNEAYKMLDILRNRAHEVHTGISVIDLHSSHELHGSHTAEVRMRAYSDQEMDMYIATGDPLDKAGAYAIQHPQFKPVSQLQGCFLGVMGLSICHLLQILSQFDVPVVVDMATLQQAHQEYDCPVYDKITRKHSK
jgi:septum formation protein